MTIKHLFPSSWPTLNLDFANQLALDPRISFSRASIGTYFDGGGVLRTAANDEPRFDHDPVTGESLGLLIEESRTNKIRGSENLAIASDWPGPDSATTSLSSITSPDGVSNMWLVDLSAVAGSSSEGSRVYQNALQFNSAVNTFSFYARSVSGTGTFPVGYYDGSDYTKSYVTLTEKTQRYEISCPAGLATSGDNIFAFTRRGTTHNETLTQAYVWGCQVEVGSFPTSYIPTTTGSTVTRAADLATIEGTNFSGGWYNQSEGTIFSDVSPLDASSGRVYLFSNGSNNQRLGQNAGSATSFALFMSQAGVATSLSAAEPGMPKPIKACLAYQLGSSRGVIDGSLKTLSAGSNVPDFINQLGIGHQSYSPIGGFFNGHISRIAYYPTRLTDEQLLGLTS
jgi:hypothetical protein